MKPIDKVFVDLIVSSNKSKYRDNILERFYNKHAEIGPRDQYWEEVIWDMCADLLGTELDLDAIRSKVFEELNFEMADFLESCDCSYCQEERQRRAADDAYDRWKDGR